MQMAACWAQDLQAVLMAVGEIADRWQRVQALQNWWWMLGQYINFS